MSSFRKSVKPKRLHRYLPASARFWYQVDKLPTDPDMKAKGCWLWTGDKVKDGYGRIRVDGKQKRAHVFAYEMEYGPVPAGLQVLHSCDNPPCVNFEHLSAGTTQMNTAERVERGRSLKGERNHKAKLDADAVRSIRARYAAGERNKSKLARELGVTNMLIGKIIRRELWKHI